MRTNVALLGGFAVAVVAAACGDDFESSSGTGGAAGSAGTAATGGSSASGGTAGSSSGGSGGKPCSDSTECDDGLACNGVETCKEDVCQPGTPPDCANPDSEHCTATCVEPAGTCVVEGNDKDQDGHKDAHCSADPGDDCDDGQKSVHPGAGEICDGHDNDCDGLDDLKDGFQLAGAAKQLVGASGIDAYAPEVAWCPGGQKFVVVWTDTRNGSPQIYGASLTPGGVLGLITEISPSGDEVDPRIACSGSQCAVVWRHTTSPHDIFMRRIDCNIAPLASPVNVTEAAGAADLGPAVTAFNGGWLVGFLYKNSVGLQASMRFANIDGVFQTSPTVVQTSSDLSWESALAASGSHAAFVWARTPSGMNPEVVEWSRIDQSLAPSAPEALSPAPPPTGEASRGPEVVAHGSGFAIAWRKTTSGGTVVRYMDRSSTGAIVCDAPSIGAFAVPRVGGIASHTSGALLATVDGAGPTNVSMTMLRVKDCQLVDTHELTTVGYLDSPNERSLAIAGGDQGYAAVWEQGGGSQRQIHGRVFGPSLCD